jgi:4-amino-4-deoxy-L-arabinose transferase-like glycosyltransferase
MREKPYTEFPTTAPSINVPNWALILAFIAYALPGNLGHAPWRGDDALHIGVAFSMLQDGTLLTPQIGGTPYVEWPPLLYWLGMLTGRLFGWLLPLHDAIRLAGVIALGTLFVALRYTARELYGREAASAAAMLALGSLGLLVHAHEMQPQVLFAACIATTLCGLAYMRTSAVRGALIAGAGTGAAFLAAGLPAIALCLPLWFVLPLSDAECRSKAFLGAYLHALWPAALLIALWPLALYLGNPEYLGMWWARECLNITPHTGHLQRWKELANLFGWFTWPLWPVVLWSIWFRRKNLIGFGHILPLVSIVLALVLITSTGTMRPANVVPLLPALIVLASGELSRLRRGAANAFDWFGLITFTLVGVALWISWSAINFGWPAPLARNILRLVPGFRPSWNIYELTIAIVLSVAWIIAIVRLPFFPLRGAVHWALGVTLMWGLTTTLWLPWFDHDKNYAPVAQQFAQQVKAQGDGCVAGLDTGDSQRAALYYFTGIGIKTGPEAESCKLLLAYASGRHPLPTTGAQWVPVWQTERGKGRLMEHFGLYRRTTTN